MFDSDFNLESSAIKQFWNISDQVFRSIELGAVLGAVAAGFCPSKASSTEIATAC